MVKKIKNCGAGMFFIQEKVIAKACGYWNVIPAYFYLIVLPASGLIDRALIKTSPTNNK